MAVYNDENNARPGQTKMSGGAILQSGNGIPIYPTEYQRKENEMHLLSSLKHRPYVSSDAPFVPRSFHKHSSVHYHSQDAPFGVMDHSMEQKQDHYRSSDAPFQARKYKGFGGSIPPPPSDNSSSSVVNPVIPVNPTPPGKMPVKDESHTDARLFENKARDLDLKPAGTLAPGIKSSSLPVSDGLLQGGKPDLEEKVYPQYKPIKQKELASKPDKMLNRRPGSTRDQRRHWIARGFGFDPTGLRQAHSFLSSHVIYD